MQNSYRIVAAVALAGVIAVPLYLLEHHRDHPVKQAGSEQPAGPQPSGNPTADRIHEMKALEEELTKKPEHAPILFRMSQLAIEAGKPSEAIAYLRRLLKVEPAH